MALKLNEQGYDILKDELTKCEGPFSKTQNVMLALDLMAKGEELTQVTKAHLSNIIKVLCVKLRWNEEPVEVKNEQSPFFRPTSICTATCNISRQSISAAHSGAKEQHATSFFRPSK